MIIIRKHSCPQKITDITGVTGVTVLNKRMGIGKIMVGRWVRTCPSIYLFRLKIAVGCLTSTYPSIHFSPDEDTLKITVGCLTSTYPSIHKKTLKITVGCPLCTYPSIRNKNFHTCGLWARPPVLSPVPSQAIHSRTGLNLHYSDIQSTAQKSPCVNTF